MKPLELTKEHKIKLLEMCKKLFPEYTKIQFYEIYNIETGNLYFEINNTGNTIHWFEFVMTTLCSNLYKLFFKKMDTQNNLWDLLTKEGFYIQVLHHRTIHPIDYLYEEFKKLK